MLANCAVELDQHVCRGQDSGESHGRQWPHDNGARDNRPLLTFLSEHQIDLGLRLAPKASLASRAVCPLVRAARQAKIAPSIAPTPPTAVEIAATFSQVLT
jgi:hypothetical protein